MIKNTLDKLMFNENLNVSNTVEEAKGKYELVTTWKGAFKKIKRLWRLKNK